MSPWVCVTIVLSGILVNVLVAFWCAAYLRRESDKTVKESVKKLEAQQQYFIEALGGKRSRINGEIT